MNYYCNYCIIWAIYTPKGGLLGKSFKHDMIFIEFEIYIDLWTIWFLQQARTNKRQLTLHAHNALNPKASATAGQLSPGQRSGEHDGRRTHGTSKSGDQRRIVWRGPDMESDGRRLFGVFGGRRVTSCPLSRVWDMYSILYMYSYIISIIYIYIHIDGERVYTNYGEHGNLCRQLRSNSFILDFQIDKNVQSIAKYPCFWGPKMLRVWFCWWTVGGDEVWRFELQKL